MNISFLDLKKNYLSIKNEIDNEFTELFNKCDFILGEIGKGIGLKKRQYRQFPFGGLALGVGQQAVAPQIVVHKQLAGLLQLALVPIRRVGHVG